MSSTDAIETPTFPTSPCAIGASGSWPICVGRSNATESPVWPWSRRKRYRLFVSAADPNPAYCRIVQSRPRWPVGWMPRVYGNCPGSPSFLSSRDTSSGP